jgi:hypothetical protein
VNLSTGEVCLAPGGKIEPLKPNPTYLTRTDTGIVAVTETYGDRPQGDGSVNCFGRCTGLPPPFFLFFFLQGAFVVGYSKILVRVGPMAQVRLFTALCLKG